MTEPAGGPDPAGTPADVAPVEETSPKKAIVLLVVVALCFAVIAMTPLRESVEAIKHHQRPQWIDDLRGKAAEAGATGALVFTLAAAVGVAIGVPRLLLAFVGGALYGWIAGSALAQAGTFLGSWATFLAGRHLARKWVQSVVTRKFPKAKALLDFIARHGFEANLVLRLTPVGNAFATNLLFSISKVRSATFLTATFLGTLPETVALALVGSAVKGTEFEGRILGGSLVLAALAIATAWWTRRLRRRREA